MQNTAILLLRLSAFFVLFGRGWQHLVWDAPYRNLFWDEGLLSPIVVGFFHTPWDAYATSPLTNAVIRKLIGGIGWFYMLGAVICLLPKNFLQKSRITSILPWASLSLALLAFLYSRERFYQVGQGIEYAAQVFAPFFFYAILKTENFSERFLLAIKAAVALTFVGHGLYAAGYYNVPGGFIDMVINILGVEQKTAVHLLFWAGVLDFIVAVGIFIPRFDRFALAYAFSWGLATSLARLLGNFDSAVPIDTLNQWLPEVIMRLPHAGLPLAILFAVGWNYRDSRKRTNVLRFSSESPL